MPIRPKTSRGKPRGFTLIEILVVAALLSLFAGIAIININEMYKNNVRKAIIGETRQVATACSMARDDIGFYPKLNYLAVSRALITKDDGKTIKEYFDYMSFYNPGAIVAPSPGMVDNWQSMGYFAMSQTRSQMSRGRGGVAKVRLAENMSAPVVDWPADAWGNPYVLYLLKPHVGAETDNTPEWRFVESVSDSPDYMVAVVSYGPDGVPGSTYSPTGMQSLPIVSQEQKDARLFRDNIGAGDAKFFLPHYTNFRYVDRTGYGEVRTEFLRIKGKPWEGDYTAPPDPYGRAVEIRGILDPGSDDLVYQF
jgi:prepilin-type N-terminal cleavage/methylation domain-containing protein